MANHFVTAQIMIFRTGEIKGGRHDVIDSSATDTTQMIVFGRIGVKAGLAAGVFEFLDHTHPGEQVKVTVDCAQADSRQSPANELVEFQGSGMGSNRLQFLQNHLPLRRFAAMASLSAVRRRARRRQAPRRRTGSQLVCFGSQG